MEASKSETASSADRQPVRWHWVVAAVSVAVAYATSLWAYRSHLNEVLLESEVASLNEMIHQKEIVLAEAARYSSAMERRVQLLVQNKPFLPIRMTLANELVGYSNKTIVLRNMQVVPLSVAARFVDPALKRETTMVLEFGPGESVEIGPEQGWAFATGHEITLINENYLIKRLRVP